MFRFRLMGATLVAVGIFGTSSVAAIAASGSAVRQFPAAALLRRLMHDPRLGTSFAASLARMRPHAVSPLFGAHSLAWADNELYEFGGPDGNQPNALVAFGGALYGTTFYGGTSSACYGGCGTVFKLTPPPPGQVAWSQTVLYSFAGNEVPAVFDGASPQAGLYVDASGALYGTTTAGGNSACYGSGCGTIFKLTPPVPPSTTWTESVLYAFSGTSDGSYPASNLIAYKGALYGTAEDGGLLGAGTAFALKPPVAGQTAWTLNAIHSFGAPGDGRSPEAGFVESDGALYSTTAGGGDSVFGGFGTAFELAPPPRGQTAWTESILHSFTAFDGSSPSNGLIKDRSGSLYGTTYSGGDGGCLSSCGTVFKLQPPARGESAWTHSVLHYFTARGGYGPLNDLTGDSNGNLYGMALEGGLYGGGTVFKLTPPKPGTRTWKIAVLHDFTGGVDGAFPYNDNLILDPRGALYGATSFGGADACQCGVVFKLTP